MWLSCAMILASRRSRGAWAPVAFMRVAAVTREPGSNDSLLTFTAKTLSDSLAQ